MNCPRIYLAVDAANLYLTRDEGARLNYRALLDFAGRMGNVVESTIYVPRSNGAEKERGLLVALKFIGFTRVIARTLRQRPDGQRKSDVDVTLVLDLWAAALAGAMDVVVLASGDSDFVPLVERLVQQGIRVIVVGPDHATAWELIVAATQFFNVSAVEGLIQAEAIDHHAQPDGAVLDAA